MNPARRICPRQIACTGWSHKQCVGHRGHSGCDSASRTRCQRTINPTDMLHTIFATSDLRCAANSEQQNNPLESQSKCLPAYLLACVFLLTGKACVCLHNCTPVVECSHWQSHPNGMERNPTEGDKTKRRRIAKIGGVPVKEHPKQARKQPMLHTGNNNHVKQGALLQQHNATQRNTSGCRHCALASVVAVYRFPLQEQCPEREG